MTEYVFVRYIWQRRWRAVMRWLGFIPAPRFRDPVAYETLDEIIDGDDDYFLANVGQATLEAAAECDLSWRDMPRDWLRDAIHAKAAAEQAEKVIGIVQRPG